LHNSKKCCTFAAAKVKIHTMSDKEPLYFLSFCVEAYKMRHGMSGDDALALFDRKGVTSYLTEHYDVLHTQGKDWLVDDIDQFIQNRQ